MKRSGWILVVMAAFAAAGCDDNAEKETADKAKIEGKASAEGDLSARLENQEQLRQQAYREGKAAAEAELAANNANLAAKAHLMEADLATRQLFYQANRGTYEGALATERGEFKLRITLVPSLPPYTS